MSVLKRKYKNVKLVAPSMTVDAYQIWLPAFLQACKGCQFDSFAIHYYLATNITVDVGIYRLKTFIAGMRSIVGSSTPIWLAETGARNSSLVTKEAWLKAAFQLASTEGITHFAAFPVRAHALRSQSSSTSQARRLLSADSCLSPDASGARFDLESMGALLLPSLFTMFRRL